MVMDTFFNATVGLAVTLGLANLSHGLANRAWIYAVWGLFFLSLAAGLVYGELMYSGGYEEGYAAASLPLN